MQKYKFFRVFTNERSHPIYFYILIIFFKKNLKLRNVTIFSARFGLEVSVAVDGLATDGAKYTANFLNSQDLIEQTEDPRF